MPTVEIKDYNVMIDIENFFDYTNKSYIKTYKDVKKIPISQRNHYTTCCLLSYLSLNKYKLIPIDLLKQQALCQSKSNTANSF